MGIDLALPALVLGAINGVGYGLLAIGLVLVLRSSRIINFALGEIGAVGAVVLVVAVERWDVSYWAALPFALGAAALVAAGVNATVIRRLRAAPPVMALIATLGVGQLLLFLSIGLETLVRDRTRLEPPGIPAWEVGGYVVDPAHIAGLVSACVAVGGLSLFLARHRVGRSIRATTVDPELARTSGISPLTMSSLVWGISGVLSAMVAILLAPGGTPGGGTLGFWLLLRALAAVTVSGTRSVLGALAAGIAIGVVEQIVFWNTLRAGARDVVVLMVIAAAMLIRRSPAGRAANKAQWLQLVPLSASLKTIRAAAWLRRSLAAAVLGLLLLVLVLAGPTSAARFHFVFAFATVALSVGIVTGLGGQLSLAQFAVAGAGAAASIQITRVTGNFFLGTAGAAAVGAATACLLGLAVLRQREQALAVVTLAFAVAAESALFFHPMMFGDGVFPGQPIVGGVPLENAQRYVFFTFALFLVALAFSRNVWRTTLGRRLRAQRDNDEAARSFSLTPWKTRLQGYAVGGAVAGIGGVAFAHGLSSVGAATFPVESSVQAVASTALGGIATLAGPVIGALYVAGVPELLPQGYGFLATTTIGWLLTILVFPGGLLQAGATATRRLVAHGQRAPTPPALSDVSGVPTLALIRRPPEAREIDALLHVRSVSKAYRDVVALDEVELSVAPGDAITIIGPNGAGKTTLFDVISGLVSPDAGRVLYDGVDITRWAAERRAAAGLVRSFEDAALFPTLTVRDSVRLALELHARSSVTRALIRGDAVERASAGEAAELMHLFGLAPYAGRPVGALSTGMRRLTELACMVALKPRLLLLDEPASGLAQSELEPLVDIVTSVKRHLGLTLMVVEHNLVVGTGLGSRILELREGRIASERGRTEIARSSGLSPRTGRSDSGMIDP